MMAEDNQQSIYWGCRRGMLELDMLLQPFAKHRYSSLPADKQTDFSDLLQQQDCDLFQWLVLNKPVPDARYQSIVDLIREFGTQTINRSPCHDK